MNQEQLQDKEFMGMLQMIKSNQSCDDFGRHYLEEEDIYKYVTTPSKYKKPDPLPKDYHRVQRESRFMWKHNRERIYFFFTWTDYPTNYEDLLKNELKCTKLDYQIEDGIIYGNCLMHPSEQFHFGRNRDIRFYKATEK